MSGAGAVTHRRVLVIALPILLSNTTIPLLGAVDTGVIGQLGEAAPIGAVGLGAIILASVYWVFGFLRMGTTGLAAQAIGAGDRAEAAAVFARALVIAAGAGLLCIVLQLLLFRLAFWAAPASAEVEDLTGTYLAIRIWGAPATIALYAVNGWLIANERTRAVLVLQLWIGSVNAALDLWAVLAMGWGVEGVAAATLVAEWSGLGLGLWLCRAAFAGGVWPDRARILDRVRLRRMASVNADIMLRSVLLQGAFTTFLFLGAGLGDVTLAANQILLQFMEVTAYALDGFAFAAEAIVGQAKGARTPLVLRRGAILTSAWGLAMTVPIVLLFAFGGGPVIDLMTTAPDVRAEARLYLPWMVAAPAIGLPCWMLDGVFFGATATRALRNSTFVSTLVYVAALLVLVPALDNHGLWAAMLVLFAVRGVTLGRAYPALERAAA